MCYSDNKCSNFSQKGNLELQHNNEVLEESECTTVMVARQETNYQKTNSLLGVSSRSLVNSFIAAPLTILSMLEGANGSQTSSLTSSHCHVSLDICGLISTGEVARKVSSTIRKAVLRSEAELSGPCIGVDIPLTIDDSDDCADNQLNIMDKYLRIDYYKSLEYLENSILGPSDANYAFCRDNVIKFCDRNHHRNTTISDVCCPSINSYIRELVHPTTTSTTLSSTVESTTLSSTVESTTLVSTVGSTTMSSTIKSTTVNSTEIVQDENDKSALIIVLVLFLFIGVAILSFMGYRRFKLKNEQHQPVLQNDDINEVEEDLV